MKNKRMLFSIIFGILLILLFSFFIYGVNNDIFINFDNNIYNFISGNITSGKTLFYKIITFFGSGLCLFLLALIILFSFKNKKIGGLTFLNLIIAFLLNALVKTIIARPRPEGINIVLESGFSFPSGHTMVSISFYIFLIYLIYKFVNNKALKNCLFILISFLILFIPISRIYLGVHYASDVCGGVILSLIYMCIFYNVFFDKYN